MKKLLLLFFLSSCATLKNEGGKLTTISDNKMPEQMQLHLRRFCETPKNSKYYSSKGPENLFYVAKLKCDGNRFIITYSGDGAPLMAEMQINSNHIPEIVLTNLLLDLERSFSDYKIKGVTEITIHKQFKYRFIMKATSDEEVSAHYAVFTDSYGSIREIKKFPD